MDMLLTAGERISMALLAMALHERGVAAVSYTGSQAGILTDSSHGEARITRITGERVRDSLAEGKVVIVAGFQGVDPDRREVTTLGRGGSDTTAVALAAALGAEACEILTDVPGVFSADPRVVPEAVKLDEIGYESMITLARAGAGVLMPQSVEMARDQAVVVEVRSSFDTEPGTRVHAQAIEPPVVGLAHSLDPAAVAVVGAGAVESVAVIRAALESASIPYQSITSEAHSVSIAVAPEQIEETVRCLHRAVVHLEAAR
jgi:aspartate kinase